jgi:hypothetical protein
MILNRRSFFETMDATPDPVGDTSPGEALQSAFDTTVATELSISIPSALYSEYEDEITKFQSTTGRPLFNPLAQQTSEAVARLEQKFQKEAAKAMEEHPDLVMRTPDEIREKIAKDRDDIRRRDARLQLGEGGIVTGVARFGGATGAILTDPPILGSMVIGAPVASGVIRTALIEGLIGVGSEAVVQAGVQAGRQQLGEKADLGQAAANITLAGAGGALLGGVLKAAAKGTRALVQKYRDTPEAHTGSGNDAAAYLDRLHELEDANPFEDTPLGRAEHQRLLDGTFTRFLEGRPTPETAVGRVLGADVPVRLKTEVFEETVGEPVAAFLARAREANPGLFAQSDQIASDLAKAEKRLEKVQNDLEAEVSGDVAQAERLATLEAQRAAATDRRKIKRLDRQIREVDPEVRKRAQAESRKRARLKSEAEKLPGEIDRLRKQGLAVENTINEALRRQSAAPARQATFVRARQIMDQVGDDLTARSMRKMLKGAEEALEKADAETPLGDFGPVSRDTSSPSPHEQIVPADEAAQRQADEVLEEAVRSRLEDDPDIEITIQDDDGTIRTLRSQELLDDFKADEDVLRELKDCIRSNLV